MPTVISLRLPFETGTRLHNLALALGTTVTDTVAMLLDHVAQGGLGTLALPGIDISVENGTAISVKFDNIATKPLSRADAKAFAHRIRTVSSVVFVDTLDCPDWIKVSRMGRAIVIEDSRSERLDYTKDPCARPREFRSRSPRRSRGRDRPRAESGVNGRNSTRSSRRKQQGASLARQSRSRRGHRARRQRERGRPAC